MKDNLKIAIIFVVVVAIICDHTKPEIFYDRNKRLKCFGLKSNETIFPLWLFFVVFGLFVYSFQIFTDIKYIQ